jgi:multiple sugar transport system permease protein
MAITQNKSAPAALPHVNPGGWQRFNMWLDQEKVLGYVLLGPALILLLIFVAYPFAYGLYISMTDARIGHPGQFVGLDNFAQLLSDPIFIQTVNNSLAYTIVTTIFKLVIGMVMALLLNQAFPLKRIVRAAVLLPWIIPTVLSTLAWLWMFDSTYSVFNWLLNTYFNIQGPIWLSDRINFRLGDTTLFHTTWPLISIMIVNIWRGVPFYAISLLAGLQTISPELEDAAAIDGARPWQRFWHVTWPLLLPVTLVVVVFSVIQTFSDFQLIYVLTGGGPANATHLLATYAYQIGVATGLLGEGAAISLFMLPVLFVVVWVQLRYLRRLEGA